MDLKDAMQLQQPVTDGAIRSVNFFNGRLLAGKDLTREQAARREELRVLDRVTFDCRQRFCSVWNARRVAKVDKPLVRQMLVQRTIDRQSTNAAVEDANGKILIQSICQNRLR